MLMAYLRLAGFLASVAAAFAASEGLAQQQGNMDERRCTGQITSTAEQQVAACTALIESGRYSTQNLAIIHSNRGIAHGKASDFERAIADFDAAIRINPNHARAYFNRGNAQLAQRDLDGAVRSFDQAIRLDPKNAASFLGRGSAHAAKADDARAVADYDQAIRLDGNLGAAYFHRGLAHRRLGAAERAI